MRRETGTPVARLTTSAMSSASTSSFSIFCSDWSSASLSVAAWMRLLAGRGPGRSGSRRPGPRSPARSWRSASDARGLELALELGGWRRWRPSPPASARSSAVCCSRRSPSSASSLASRLGRGRRRSPSGRATRSISSWRTRRVDHVDLGRHGVDLDAEPAGGLVDEVDRLVRQEAAGDVAVRQHRGGDQRRVL